MATLHVYLTEGFKDDRVAVSVDGQKVFDESGITTKKLIGLAKQLGPITVAGDTARLEIKLPEKGLSTTISADLSKGNHVPIALEGGELTHSVERQIGFA
ncbi:MAG TPA: hypothetical protein VIY51_24380 [Xanthobacteraceae bacterium]